MHLPRTTPVISLFACLLLGVAQADEEDDEISPPMLQGDFLVHRVESAYQNGWTEFRVLTPSELRDDARYTAVYVLPVEARRESRYGDGLAEVRKLGLHDRYQAIFVAPTFSDLPWYADHPSDRKIRQESFLLRTVIPFIDETYPTAADASHRVLLGFSKSGWGAWSLLLRHPDVFGRAAAWDAPLMMSKPGPYGSGPIFGTQANFDQYRLTALLRTRAAQLQGAPRLILTGYGNFREEHQAMHSLLEELKIPHVSRDGPQRKHDWHSGWVEEAVQLLAPALARD